MTIVHRSGSILQLPAIFLVRKNSLIATPNDRYTKQKDKVTKRAKGKNQATGIITEVICLQQIGRSPMYKLLNAKLSLGIMKWMAGTVLVPDGFQF